MSETRVDARGMRCPWPVLRLARAMRTAERVIIHADDPLAPAEIARLAEERGWAVSIAGDAITVVRPPR